MENACDSGRFKHITTAQLCKNKTHDKHEHITKDSERREVGVGGFLMIITL